MKVCNILSNLGWLGFVSVGMAQNGIVYNDPSADCIQLRAGEEPKDVVLKMPSNITDDVIVSPASLLNDSLAVETPLPGNDNPQIPDNILEPCFTVVGEADQWYRLTIRTYDYHTRFALSERPIEGSPFSQGYAWGGTADGIYYCIQGKAQFDFWNEPSIATALNESRPVGSTVRISSEAVADGKLNCTSEYIGFNGVLTPPSDPNSTPIDRSPLNGTEVFWSDHRFLLKANHFEYMVTGETPVTMKGATNSEIRGDPGGEFYHSIEITWYIEGKEKRLYIYVDANDEQVWNIGEVRVYNDQQDWETFRPTNWTMPKGACFKKERFVLTNPRGSEIVFENLALATFRPWGDEMAYLDCIDGMKVVLPDGTDVRAAVTTLSNALNALPTQIDIFSGEEGGRVQAFISARDRNELCTFQQRIHAGSMNVEIVASAPIPWTCTGKPEGEAVQDSPAAIVSHLRSMILVSLLGILML